jgi:hypothetical protein
MPATIIIAILGAAVMANRFITTPWGGPVRVDVDATAGAEPEVVPVHP